MTAIHIVQGKPSLSANIIAAKVKASPRYDYRVIENTDDACEIAFYEGDQELGRSGFSMKDAARAGLNTKDNWKKYPRNMLFSRAMSNGARWFCPDAFAGITIYTPEELGAQVDGETGDVIDVTPRRVEPEQVAAPEKGITTTQDRVNELLAAVNEKTGGHYRHAKHLFNALKKDGDGSFDWPHPADRDTWNALYKQAVARVEAKADEDKTGQPEEQSALVEFFDGA